MNFAKPFPVVLIVLLSAIAGLGACSENEGPIAPPAITPPPTGAVLVDVSPDSSLFTWSLIDADTNTHTGWGDSVLTGFPVGDCEMIWGDLAGFHTPDPRRETRSVVAGDTISFSVTYSTLPTEPVKILLLGSSYFGVNRLVDLFAGLAEAQGKDVVIDGHYPSGQYLTYHETSPTTDALIRSQDWDYVILQGVGRITAYPDDAPFRLLMALYSIKRKVDQHCSDATVMFQMPWAFEDGMLWTPGGTDDYFAMQQRIYDETLELAAGAHVAIAPVGWAWNTVMHESPPKHYLFMADWNHPSLRGSYLMACVFYASVFRESVTGATYHGGLAATEARHFQAVASSVVLDDLELWHLEEEEQ
ncbi:MAG: hypothetical protein GY838_15170 [bacterium]|nr:hypothetical protein [bacterium]